MKWNTYVRTREELARVVVLYVVVVVAQEGSSRRGMHFIPEMVYAAVPSEKMLSVVKRRRDEDHSVLVCSFADDMMN